jgi:hypothetical protein
MHSRVIPELMIPLWGRDIAPVPSSYFLEPFRLGPVRSLEHQSVSKVEILLYHKGQWAVAIAKLPVWISGVVSWDGGDAR